jgi:hypothetical protein
MKKLIKFLGSFFQSETNESSKRAIAILFSVTMVVIYFFSNDVEIKKLLIYCYSVLIALLLGLATAETIVGIFKKEN